MDWIWNIREKEELRDVAGSHYSYGWERNGFWGAGGLVCGGKVVVNPGGFFCFFCCCPGLLECCKIVRDASTRGD